MGTESKNKIRNIKPPPDEVNLAIREILLTYEELLNTPDITDNERDMLTESISRLKS